jgi:hypothetical protein
MKLLLQPSITRLALLLACLSAADAARAQFGRNANQPFSGSVTIINEFKATPQSTAVTPRDVAELSRDRKIGAALERQTPILLQPNTSSAPAKSGTPKRLTVNLGGIMMQKYAEARTQMEAKAPAFFNERAIGPDRGADSFRTSKTHLNLNPSPQLFAGTDGRGFTLRALVPGNRISTYIRTPGPVPGGLDPGFQTQFDLELIVDVELRGTQLVASPARIKANVQRPTGKNLTGQAALIVADLVKEFGGPDWIGQLMNVVNAREFPVSRAITQELTKFSPILTKAQGKVAIMPGYDAATQGITITVANAGQEPYLR